MERCVALIIFLISTISYIKGSIIIPFETYNPLSTKDEALLNLFINSSDKEIVDILINNLIYINLNIGKDNFQNIPVFIDMGRRDIIFYDYKNPKNKEEKTNLNSNSYNQLLKNTFLKRLYNSEKSKSYNSEKECFEFTILEIIIKNICANEYIQLFKKNNVNDEIKELDIEIDITFKIKLESEFRPGFLGLNINSQFIDILKKKREINGYNFYFKYTDLLEEKGEIIFGDLPHIYNSKAFEEEKLRTAKLSKEQIYKWSVNIDIYISSTSKVENVLEIEKTTSFDVGEFFIIGSNKYLNYIEKNFFKKYLDDNICKRNSYDRKNNYETITYFICYMNNKEQKKEILDAFPPLILYQREMNHIFTLEAKDLFTIIPDDKRILFNIIFNNKENWTFGKQFFKKYQLIFNSDSNLISYYINDKIDINKENSGNDTNNKNIWKIILIIILTIFAFSIGIIFGKALCSKYYRKLRANELEDNFSYIVDENKEKNQNNNIKDINEQKNEFKSKYYNLN